MCECHEHDNEEALTYVLHLGTYSYGDESVDEYGHSHRGENYGKRSFAVTGEISSHGNRHNAVEENAGGGHILSYFDDAVHRDVNRTGYTEEKSGKSIGDEGVFIFLDAHVHCDLLAVAERTEIKAELGLIHNNIVNYQHYSAYDKEPRLCSQNGSTVAAEAGALAVKDYGTYSFIDKEYAKRENSGRHTEKYIYYSVYGAENYTGKETQSQYAYGAKAPHLCKVGTDNGAQENLRTYGKVPSAGLNSYGESPGHKGNIHGAAQYHQYCLCTEEVGISLAERYDEKQHIHSQGEYRHFPETFKEFFNFIHINHHQSAFRKRRLKRRFR